MKKISIAFFILFTVVHYGYSQQAEDLFKVGKIKFFGIDFSHVKLIGDFSQFNGIGATTPATIRDTYFPAWNNLLMEEPDKFNLKTMLRKDDISVDLTMVTSLNVKTALETLEGTTSPIYTKEDIQKFIRNYSTQTREGMAVLFVAESLNKTLKEGYFHFVLFRLTDNEILIHERIKGIPQGMSIRNYWAGSIFKVMESIQKVYYGQWKSKYVK